MKDRIGFVGLGLMGQGMATNIVQKGWPLTIRGHRNRKPVEDLVALGATEAPDLAALAHRLDRGIGGLAPALRESAGFDWPGFVREGWKQRKYGYYEREGWLYAAWAAELGDPSALRRLAERTAEGQKWERDQLTRLIPAAPADLIPFLRQNLAGLTYAPATRIWR